MGLARTAGIRVTSPIAIAEPIPVRLHHLFEELCIRAAPINKALLPLSQEIEAEWRVALEPFKILCAIVLRQAGSAADEQCARAPGKHLDQSGRGGLEFAHLRHHGLSEMEGLVGYAIQRSLRGSFGEQRAGTALAVGFQVLKIVAQLQNHS